VTRRRRVRAGLLALVLAGLAGTACGKKGPPLPPLNLLPTPPADFSAVRRDAKVDLTFKVPGSNTDRSTPADLTRVEVYALSSAAPVTSADVVRDGTRVATVAVNKPKDPDEPEPKTPAPKGPGLDQNEVANISDELPSGTDASSHREYVAVGINTRGRRGALSPRIAVPLVDPPPAPAEPRITYDEKAISLTWPAVVESSGQAGLAYSVYQPGSIAALTATPVRDPVFVDSSIEWEKQRCYEVRSVATVENVRIESASSPAACVMPRDTFAPAAPQGLVGVGSEGSISLIWTANSEPDLAGYIVLRAIDPSTELAPVTPGPIRDTNFRDTVPTGARATYAVQAVDKAGNRSAVSNQIAETAR
jgi:hypothetical protein